MVPHPGFFYALQISVYRSVFFRTKAPSDEGAGARIARLRERKLLFLLPLSQKSEISDSSPNKGSLSRCATNLKDKHQFTVPHTAKAAPEWERLLSCILVVACLNHAAIGQVFHVGVLDQLLGTDRCTQTAVVALGVVDHCQILLDGNGVLGADLLTQTAADAADGATTGRKIGRASKRFVP